MSVFLLGVATGVVLVLLVVSLLLVTFARAENDRRGGYLR